MSGNMIDEMYQRILAAMIYAFTGPGLDGWKIAHGESCEIGFHTWNCYLMLFVGEFNDHLMGNVAHITIHPSKDGRSAAIHYRPRHVKTGNGGVLVPRPIPITYNGSCFVTENNIHDPLMDPMLAQLDLFATVNKHKLTMGSLYFSNQNIPLIAYSIPPVPHGLHIVQDMLTSINSRLYGRFVCGRRASGLYIPAKGM